MTLNPFQVVVQDDQQLDLLFTSRQPEAEAEAASQPEAGSGSEAAIHHHRRSKNKDKENNPSILQCLRQE